jgi:phage-related protein
MVAKNLIWAGRSLDDIRDFPEDARREAGHQLHLVQLGQDPDDYRPMPTVGPGVVEIRIHADNECRVFYVAKLADGFRASRIREEIATDQPTRY